MKLIKYSRCHNKRDVPDDWKFKECGKCHARTERRFPVIKQYEKRAFKIEQLPSFQFRPFEDYLAFVSKGKRISKDAREEIKKDWQRRKTDWEKDNSKRIAQLDSLFAIKTYPLHSRECIKVRIEAKKYLENKDSVDIFPIHDHCRNCESCNEFFYALRQGYLEPLPSIDPQTEEEMRKEGFCNYAEWKKRMDEFQSGFL